MRTGGAAREGGDGSGVGETGARSIGWGRIRRRARTGEGRVLERGGRGLWFALPWLVGFFVLDLVPVVGSLVLSFVEWDGLSFDRAIRWVGFANYRALAGFEAGQPADPLFYKSLWNSLVFTLAAVPAGVGTSLGLAMLLRRRVFGGSVLRLSFVLPYVLSGTATVMIWSWLFNPRFGPVNEMIRGVGGWVEALSGVSVEEGGPGWFYSPVWCKPALLLMHLWTGGGATMVFLAALGRVPRSLEESSFLDGAGWWSRFRHVVWPHVAPAVWFNLVIGFIFTMQSFDDAYLLFNRSQRDGLLFYVLRLYRVAFEPPYSLGRASAMAWMLFAVIAVMVGAVFMAARRSVSAEVNR